MYTIDDYLHVVMWILYSFQYNTLNAIAINVIFPSVLSRLNKITTKFRKSLFTKI